MQSVALIVRLSVHERVNMRYQISGKQIDIGMALQQHVKGEIDDVVSKYAERPTDAIVVFLSGHSMCEAYSFIDRSNSTGSVS